MKKITLILLVLFGTVLVARCAAQLPTATATIKVIDDEGSPVEGAKVGIGFEVIPYMEGGSKMYGKAYHGLTKKEGTFTASSECVGFLHYGAEKPGYYAVQGVRFNYTGSNLGSWTPVNPELPAVMKKIINPVPMYVREVSLMIPETDKAIGFDLVVGDWVAPYGGGQYSDFIFFATCRWVSYQDFSYEVNISFKNPDDGIQIIEKSIKNQSALVSPQSAPESGYENSWKYFAQKGPDLKRIGLDRKEADYNSYIFRTRTARDESNQIIKSNYGKIIGEIRTGHGEGKPDVVFTYYFNPDPHSRSLEFDPTKNLATEQKYKYAP